ncbi:MAG: class I SAM-dependent methyltransferase, partial [Sphaerochaeta sp.]|uniref:class I SAM-dependent methyltransferase n=1 Tax=Sphaerochaeta sp. TaxID=1972642 RepID=UPI003D0FA27C
MDYTEKDFGKILKGNALKMRRLMLKSGTSCMRVYDRNLERFPVTVDLYGPYARVTDYSVDGLDAETERVCCDIVSRMLYVQTDHVVFHRRPKRMGKEQHTMQGETSLEVQVTENELVFTVDLTKRIDTGLFLDHVMTRMMVQDMSIGCKVLNLFSYTGAFSVYAARGGAELVESVDLSSTYTAWAEKNLADNGFSGPMYPCICTDAHQYVMQALDAGKVYDLIIFDPPSFSNSRKMDQDFDVQRDYLRWMKVLNALLAKDGTLVFSTNLSTFRLDTQAIRGYEIQEISNQVAAPGFTRRLGTARTWLLTKQHGVRLTAFDRWSVKQEAGEDQREETNKFMEQERMNKETEEMNEQEELVVAAQEAVETEDTAVEAVEESVQEENTESAEPNQVEDDLLSLHWEEEDFAPLLSQDASEEPAQEVGEEERPRKERRSEGRDRDDRRPFDRDRRSSSRDRDERPRYNDDRRPSFRDRDERPRYNDDRRPSFRDRDERPRYNDDRRPSFRDRDERPRSNDDRRPSFRDRDERPRYNDDRRPSFRDRDERPRSNDDRRPSFRDRDERPRYNDDRRPSFRDRDEKPRFKDDRRPSFRDRDEKPRSNDDRRPSFRDRDERPRFNDDRRPSFRDRD